MVDKLHSDPKRHLYNAAKTPLGLVVNRTVYSNEVRQILIRSEKMLMRSLETA